MDFEDVPYVPDESELMTQAEFGSGAVAVEPNIFGQIVYDRVQDGKYYILTETQAIVLQDEKAENPLLHKKEKPVDTNTYQFVNCISDVPDVNRWSESGESSRESCSSYELVNVDSVVDVPEKDEPAETQTIEDDEALRMIDFAIGKNLATGQRVSLHDYFDRSPKHRKTRRGRHEKVLNKMISLGVTPAGKTLYGKILYVDKPKRTGLQILPKQKNSVAFEERYIDNVMLALKSLVNLKTMRKRMINKVVEVKVFVKTGRDDEEFVGNLQGCTCKQDSDTGSWTYLRFGNDPLEDFEERFKLRYSNHLALSIIVKKRKKTVSTLQVSVSSTEVQHSCVICNDSHENQNGLVRHYATYHPDYHTAFDLCHDEYDCPTCGKIFRSGSSLRRHGAVHDPELRVLECTICRKRYGDNSTLKKHLLAHTGFKPHVCTLCERSFAHIGDLNTHYRTHFLAVTNRFGCETCGRSFSRLGNMKRHTRIHNNGLHKCHLCGCSYQHSSSLTRHVVQVHVTTSLQKKTDIIK